jgi:hypothetical protein
MAIGNLFDNRGGKHESWKAWSGDMTFRKEDIDTLVAAYNSTGGNVTMFMNGEVKTTKNGKEYVQIKINKVKEESGGGGNPYPPRRDAAPAAASAPVVEEQSSEIIDFDDL